MAASKKDRQIVFDKCNGRCAYCGDPLQKGWYIDHKEPIHRNYERGKPYYKSRTGKRISVEEYHLIEEDVIRWGYDYKSGDSKVVGCDKPELDNIDNMLPACFSCNNYKHSATLEIFRKQIATALDKLNRDHTIYKIGKRFGLLHETPKPIVFYFETLQNIGINKTDDSNI